MNLPLDAFKRAANEARGLAMDAVHACSSGHLGLPLGCAEIGSVLFGHSLQYDPAEPRWLNRDRFVLSAGHGSMFLYSWLHLAGYAQMGIDQVKNFRVLGSHPPGHPENFETEGVECTTGPLGQGVANAVGIAVSQKMAAARFNTAAHTIFNNHVVCLAGDGCLQEGVAAEAASFAGHYKLDNLVLIYDSNDVTLDAMADASQSEDAAKRFESLGWHVQQIDGHDFSAIAAALEKAKNTAGKPHIIIAKTLIGKGMPVPPKRMAKAGQSSSKRRANLWGCPRRSTSMFQAKRMPFSRRTARSLRRSARSGRKPSTPGAPRIPSFPRICTLPSRARGFPPPRSPRKFRRSLRIQKSRPARPVPTCFNRSPPPCRLRCLAALTCTVQPSITLRVRRISRPLVSMDAISGTEFASTRWPPS
jgi:transketolase N-terminal domain/subunit